MKTNMNKQAFARRTFLRATGAVIGLPFLESLNHRAFSAAPAAAPPKRMIFLGMGFGVTEETWYPDPEDTGENYTLPEGLKPLQRHQKDFSLIQNMTHQYNDAGHWGSTFWLTGANRYAVPGSNFHNTISADQVAAEVLGRDTRFSSLQFGFDTSSGKLDGHGPGGSLSWNRQGKPIAGMDDPFQVYQRLFGDDNMPIEQKRALLLQKRSALDTVLADARSVRRKVNAADNDKLDEYFHSIREIELRLAKEEKWLGKPKPESPLEEPEQSLEGYEEIKMMYDLIVAALQTDTSRVITYRQPITTLLQSLGARITAHPMSHYNQGERMEVSQKRDKVQSELLAGLFDKLKSVKESDGSSLFDHTVLTFGSNIRSAHHLTNCPTLVAGHGGENIQQGRNIVLPTSDTPLCNMWLTLLNSIGIKQDAFGDSTGVVEQLLS